MTTLFTLVLAILTVESSYIQEIERPATRVPDTVQFWLAPESQWRIKTFAIDHDIHVHSLGHPRTGKPLTTDFAQRNIRKTYGDVVASIVVIQFTDPNDSEEGQRVLRAHHLPGRLEVAKSGFAFYNPDSREYRTKSQPKKR